jgi:hypothetical protein
MTAGLFDQLDGDGGGGVLTADEMPEMPTLESILPLSSAPSAGSRIFNVLILVLAFVHYFDADFL